MSVRTDRVGESIREILAEAVSELTDPRLRYVTITGVDVTGDLSEATAYFSVLGSEDEYEDAVTALSGARRRLQQRVAAELTSRRTPRVSFAPDHGVIQGERIDAVLRSLDLGEDGEATEDDAGEVTASERTASEATPPVETGTEATPPGETGPEA